MAIVIYVILVALVASFPIILDICLAYRSQSKMRKLVEMLIEKAATDKFQPGDLQELVKASGKPPPGIPGLARATMALTVVVILGVAVFHVLVNGGAPQILNNVLSMLGGLLAAVTGF